MTGEPVEQVQTGGLVMVFEIEYVDGEMASLLSSRQAGALRDALRWLTTNSDTDASAGRGNENG